MFFIFYAMIISSNIWYFLEKPNRFKPNKMTSCIVKKKYYARAMTTLTAWELKHRKQLLSYISYYWFFDKKQKIAWGVIFLIFRRRFSADYPRFKPICWHWIDFEVHTLWYKTGETGILYYLLFMSNVQNGPFTLVFTLITQKYLTYILYQFKYIEN